MCRLLRNIVAFTALIDVTGPRTLPAQALHDMDGRLLSTRLASYSRDEDEVSPIPVSVLTSDAITRTGEREILTLLRKRDPNFIGPGNSGPTNAGMPGTSTLSGSMLQLRGFPTLVLYEGRRLADSPALALGGPSFTDVSLFPVTLLGRIEVLKGGVSALYGSGAIGGAVNIATRDDYRGMEIGARYGFTVEPGVAERSAYVIAGTGNETTNITVGLEYYEIDALFQREREYSRYPRILSAGTTTSYAGVGRDRVGTFSNRDYLLVGVDPANPFGTAGFNSPFDAPGVTPGIVPVPVPGAGNPGQYAQLPQAYRPAQGELPTFNLSLFPTNTPDQNRTHAIGSVTHQFFGKQLEFFGDFIYAHNHNASALNAQGISTDTGVIILGSRRVVTNPITGAQTLGPENRGAPAPFNPFQLSLDSSTVSGAYRNIAANRFLGSPRTFTNDTHFYRWLGGLRSQFHENWTAESAIYYSNYSITSINAGLVNLQQLNAAIAGTAVDQNGNSFALDFFARNPIGTNPGQITAAQFNTLFGKTVRNLNSQQTAFDARVTGFPFKLPGGDVGLSFGGEYRTEGLKVDASPAVFIGVEPVQEINANRFTTAGFAELNIPIIGAEMRIPALHRLEINLAARYEHYERMPEDEVGALAAIRYQPFKDLTVRGSWSSSFIAPDLYQTNGPQQVEREDFGFIITGPGPFELTGSNPALNASTAESYNVGLVYTPAVVPGVTIEVDYFRTLQQKMIGTVGGAAILNSVNEFGPASPYYHLVAFNAFPGQPGAVPVGGPFSLIGNLGQTFYVDINQNLGAQRTEGLDLSARYNLDLKSAGQLEFGANAIVFTNYDAKSLRIGREYYNLQDLNATEISGGTGFFGVVPHYKLTFLVEYRIAGLKLSLNGSYIPETRNATGREPEFELQSTFDRVDDYFTVDGRLSYTFHGRTTSAAAVDSKDAKTMVDGRSAAVATTMTPVQKLLDQLTLTVGCNNMLDEQPPFMTQARSTTNLAVYDPYGRFVYFEVAKKF